MSTCELTQEIWQTYRARYQAGSWRAPLFRDMVLADIKEAGKDACVLDIGCGRGFDDDPLLQRSLAEASHHYVGVEPDTSITPGEYFTRVYPGVFEEAPIPPRSIDVAFAVMVLEHLERPERFWNKLHEVLAEGGVFWGFTMDGRHRFCRASLLAERLSIKDLYLGFLHGKRGSERYENYPVYYRSNTPAQISEFTHNFRQCEFVSFTCVGQLDHYVPPPLRPLANCLDRWDLRRNRPGSVLAVRVRQV